MKVYIVIALIKIRSSINFDQKDKSTTASAIKKRKPSSCELEFLLSLSAHIQRPKHQLSPLKLFHLLSGQLSHKRTTKSTKQCQNCFSRDYVNGCPRQTKGDNHQPKTHSSVRWLQLLSKQTDVCRFLFNPLILLPLTFFPHNDSPISKKKNK